MNAEAAWVRAVLALGGDRAAAEDAARDLAHRYAESHRRYHGRGHVEAVLADAERLAVAEGLDDRQSAILTLGVCAHDVVYDAKPGADEEASANWARQHLTAANVSADATMAVVTLVLTTLTHTFEPDDVTAAVLSDADLAILGTQPAIYDGYASAVREEYAAIPDDLWSIGRRQVLEGLLAKPQLFVTRRGFEQWENPARQNIARELRTLRERQ
jgi:predicted metal-dependent HD superfamily phosphohydrolase